MQQKYINIFTVFFVLATLIFIFKANDYLRPAFDNLKQGFMVVRDLVYQPPRPLSMPGVTGIPSDMQMGTVKAPPAVTYKETAVQKVILPGPLENAQTANAKIGTLTAQGVLKLTNAERKKSGVSLLSESAKLDASAQIKAKDILARQYFEHVSPDGKSVSDLVRSEGYEYLKVGENLALGAFASDADVVNAWMNSPGHKANILDANYTNIGIGIARGPYKGTTMYIVVQHFGRPASECPTIDDSLRLQIETGQNQLNSMAAAINAEAADIEKREAAGENMNAEIEAYNQQAEIYRQKYAVINNLRLTYNASVEAFNACISS